MDAVIAVLRISPAHYKSVSEEVTSTTRPVGVRGDRNGPGALLVFHGVGGVRFTGKIFPVMYA